MTDLEEYYHLAVLMDFLAAEYATTHDPQLVQDISEMAARRVELKKIIES